VNFTIEFEVKHNNIENYILMFEWFSLDTAKTERNDTPLIETWE
jgi:hypothetical protein